MVATGENAVVATVTATFNEIFEELKTVMHELSTLGETVMHNEAAGAPQQQHFANGSLETP